MKKYYATISCGLANPLYKKEVEVVLTGYTGLHGKTEVKTAEPHLMPQIRVNVLTNQVTHLPAKLAHYTGWADNVREVEVTE